MRDGIISSSEYLAWREDVGGGVVGGGAVFVCIFVGTLMLSAALERDEEAGDDICRRVRQSIISAMRNETNDIVRCVAVAAVHRVRSFLLPLDTFFHTDLTRAMINEGIRGMLLKLSRLT